MVNSICVYHIAEGEGSVEHNKTIHGLRGMSAILVILAHIYEMSYKGGFFPFRGHTILGVVAVDIFFMISGYLIIQSLLRLKDVGRFIKNRIIRIYPVFFLLNVTVFVFGPLIGYKWLHEISFSQFVLDFISTSIFLPGMFPLPIAQDNAWSLSYEFAFYIIAATMFFVITSERIHSKTARATLMGLVVSIALYVLCARPLTIFFLIGVAIYFLDRHGWRIPNHKGFIFVGLVCVVLMFLTYESSLYVSAIFGAVFFMTIVSEQGILSTLLRTPLFQYFGTISYSFYLCHPFALFPFKVLFGHYKNYIPNEYARLILFGLCGFSLAVVLSHWSYKLIEDKFTNKYLRRKNVPVSKINTSAANV